MDIFYRSLIAVGIVGMGLALYWAWNQWQLRRLRQSQAAGLPGIASLRPGIPAILYFTTPDCIPCRTAQRPALERLQTELAEELQVIEVDASARTDLADYWGVLSVPTTFIIDASGQPRRVNHGVANAAKLKQQLEEISRGGPKGDGGREKSKVPTPKFQAE